MINSKKIIIDEEKKINRFKKIIVIEGIIIVLVLILLFASSYSFSKAKTPLFTAPPLNNSAGLLSSRIYSGILSPESHLIFDFKPLKDDLNNYLNKNKINISVYVMNIRDGAEMGINENDEYEPASLNKLPIAVVVLRKIENGELSMDESLPILASDVDNRSGELYKKGYSSLPVRTLLDYMLSDSDNTAFHVLSRQVTLKDLESLSEYLNYYNDYINSSSSVFHQNIYTLTPKSTSHIFLSIYLSTFLQPEASEFILNSLTKTSYDIKKYANLPSDVIVSQKYGAYYVDDKKFFHSCGIMYMQDSRIFYCVMTKQIDEDKAKQVIGDLVNKIYWYIANTDAKLTKNFNSTLN